MNYDDDLECMTLNEVGKHGKWGKTTTYKLINEGKLKTFHAGTRHLTTRQHFRECLAVLAEEEAKASAPKIEIVRGAK